MLWDSLPLWMINNWSTTLRSNTPFGTHWHPTLHSKHWDPIVHSEPFCAIQSSLSVWFIVTHYLFPHKKHNADIWRHMKQIHQHSFKKSSHSFKPGEGLNVIRRGKAHTWIIKTIISQLTVNELLFARKFHEVRENPRVANISHRELDLAYTPLWMRNTVNPRYNGIRYTDIFD
jgi:hypothetical protein